MKPLKQYINKRGLSYLVILGLVFYTVARIGWLLYGDLLAREAFDDSISATLIFIYLISPAIFVTYFAYTWIRKLSAKPISYDGTDPLFSKAVELIQSEGKASASLLHRRLNIGYARSARILDQLEEKGYVGSSDGVEPRKVLSKSNGENRY